MKRVYDIDVTDIYFNQIKNGIKKVEGRLNKGRFKEIKINDEIIVNKKIHVQVIDKKFYKSFEYMLLSEGIKNVIPNANNINEALNVYYEFYTKEDEEFFGVISLSFKILENKED